MTSSQAPGRATEVRRLWTPLYSRTLAVIRGGPLVVHATATRRFYFATTLPRFQ